MARLIKSQLVKDLREQVQSCKQQVRQARRNPTKKNVHKLRITTRRIRATLWLAQHGTPKIKVNQLPKDLRKLGHVLGEQRQLDVAIEDAKQYQLKTQKLQSKRKESKKVLKKQLDSAHQKKLFTRLEKAAKKLLRQDQINIEPAFTKLQKKLKEWLERSSISNDELHELRILTKKVRYALEATGEEAKPLKELQGILGKVHDLEVLQELVGKSKQIKSDLNKGYSKAQKTILPILQLALKSLQAGTHKA